MDTHSSADEGDPSARFIYYSVTLSSICFLFFTCSEPTHKVKESKSFIGKNIVKPARKPLLAAKKTAKKKKKIYLTFDDGPNRGTKNVLDIAEQEDIPVTFFIVGEHVFASIGQTRTWDSLKMAKNIELCNHSYTHAHNRYNKFYNDPENVVKDVERTRESLLPDNNIVRAPGRSCWRVDSLHFTDIKKSKKAIDSLQQAGFIVFGWDLEWEYNPKTLALKNSADDLLSEIDSMFSKGKTKVKDNLVVLAHDQVYQKSGDSMQLREFIQKLKKKEDYELALVNDFPGITKETIDSIKAAPR
ncbi:MAG: polysaccharide deacetylase family protein [Bacteroidota bacterium]|nr:polysaccharide deacetylase family protein [Bacteroidota bacterium]